MGFTEKKEEYLEMIGETFKEQKSFPNKEAGKYLGNCGSPVSR